VVVKKVRCREVEDKEAKNTM